MEARSFTDEQLVAIERRDGDLLLDASAGSGKTSVLVERFARSVLEDEIDVAAILTITFTEKAAAEMRDRIRHRLRELGADEAARATEGAFISTIHGFCARVLRAHALAAGLDPAFVVLDAPDAERIADAVFEEALEELARDELSTRPPTPPPTRDRPDRRLRRRHAAQRDHPGPRRASLTRRAPAAAPGVAGAAGPRSRPRGARTGGRGGARASSARSRDRVPSHPRRCSRRSRGSSACPR